MMWFCEVGLVHYQTAFFSKFVLIMVSSISFRWTRKICFKF